AGFCLGQSFLWAHSRLYARAAYPDPTRAASWGPYLALLPVGFAVPACCQARGALLPHRFTLATRPAPLRTPGRSAVCSLLHFPSARAAQALPGTVPCGARTFLDAPQGHTATAWPTPPWAVYAVRVEHRASHRLDLKI